MPRYFFDIFDRDEIIRDTEGNICHGREDARLLAMRTLPAIARDSIPEDGDRQAFTVLVRNEDNLTVYTATMTFSGLWLGEEVPSQEDLLE